MSVEPHDLADVVDEISSMDDSALAQAVRRVHRESAEAADPIAAFGAFNQHSSSPW
jgi:FXSXX-COOH protein